MPLPDPGLVLHLPMIEGAGTTAYDASRWKNDGALTGCKWVENGLEFNGSSDYVDCGSDASLNITDAGTVIAWTKLSGAGTQRTLINKGVLAGVDAGYWLWMNNANPHFYLTDGAKDIEVTGVLNLDDDYYHLLTGVRDGDNAYLYIDGNLEFSDSEAGFGSSACGNDLIIGHRSSSKWMNGSISDVRIHNRALSAAEIKRAYKREVHRYV